MCHSSDILSFSRDILVHLVTFLVPFVIFSLTSVCILGHFNNIPSFSSDTLSPYGDIQVFPNGILSPCGHISRYCSDAASRILWHSQALLCHSKSLLVTLLVPLITF